MTSIKSISNWWTNDSSQFISRRWILPKINQWAFPAMKNNRKATMSFLYLNSGLTCLPMLGVDNRMTSSSRIKWRLFSASTCKEKPFLFYFHTRKSFKTHEWKQNNIRIYRAINYSFLQILKKLLSFQTIFVLQNITNQQLKKTYSAFFIHVIVIHSCFEL